MTGAGRLPALRTSVHIHCVSALSVRLCPHHCDSLPLRLTTLTGSALLVPVVMTGPTYAA